MKRVPGKFRAARGGGFVLGGRRSQGGQTMIEYLLLTFIIVIGTTLLFSLLKERQFIFSRITRPAVAYLKYSYKYGDKNAQGWDEGNPRNHIQITQPNPTQTFRLFLPDER